MKKYLMHIQIAPTVLLGWLLLAAWLPFASTSLSAQTFDYGNAWYDPGKNYLRFKLAEDGIYRVTAQQLLNAGFDTAGIDPSHLHLVYRGEEQYIHVDTTATGWNYLEFFGRRNDGAVDTLLYVDPYSGEADGSLHPNPHISTFSDTSAYYFYADNVLGLRLQTPFLGLMPPPIEYQEILRTSVVEYLPNQGAALVDDIGNAYNIFHSLNPAWTTAEGYAGVRFDDSTDVVLNIPTPHATNSAPAKLYLRLGTLGSFPIAMEIYVNGNLIHIDTLVEVVMMDTMLLYPYPLTDTTTLRITSTQLSPYTRAALNLVTLTYPAATDLDGGTTAIFPAMNPALAQYKFHDIASGTIAVAHDLIHHLRYADTIQVDSLGLWVAGQSTEGLLYLTADAGMRTPLIEPGISSSLSATSNAANMVLITSRALSSSAAAYQTYRQSSTVNPLNVKVVYTDEIYQEFGFGSPHPLAIKRFCKYALDEWAVKPDYFLLWGKGNADIRGTGVNHVPSYGFPASDMMFLNMFIRDSIDFLPQAAIGRVPLTTDQEGLNYVSKLSIYENMPQEPWMRNGLFIGEGRDTFQTPPIRLYMEDYGQNFRGQHVLGRPLTYMWLDTNLILTPAVNTDSAIHQGCSVIWLFAGMHEEPQLPPIDSLTNEGRFPVLIGQACWFAEYANPSYWGEADRWVLEPMKGAIAVIGHSSAAYMTPVGDWGSSLSELAFVKNPMASLGHLLQENADSILQNHVDQVYRNDMLCMNLLGDPSIHFRTGSFDVWPGDADDDLLANGQDLLSIGLAYGDTGAVRPNATLQWSGQTAAPWDSTFANGTNEAHADCNGDGTVNAMDTLAISLNYGLTHNKFHGVLTGAADDPELLIETVRDTLQDSSHVDLYLRLGTTEHPADSVYGLFVIVDLGPDLLDSASTVVNFDSCWLGTPGQDLLTMTRYFPSSGLMEIAITRTDHQPVSGEGIIARIGIVVIDNISGKRPGDTTLTPLLVAPVEARMIDPAGTDLGLQGIGKQLFILGEIAIPPLAVGRQVAIFPNPTPDGIYVQTASESPATLTLYDPTGRMVMRQAFPGMAHKRLDLSHLRAGIYILNVANADGEFQVRVTKMD